MEAALLDKEKKTNTVVEDKNQNVRGLSVGDDNGKGPMSSLFGVDSVRPEPAYNPDSLSSLPVDHQAEFVADKQDSPSPFRRNLWAIATKRANVILASLLVLSMAALLVGTSRHSSAPDNVARANDAATLYKSQLVSIDGFVSSAQGTTFGSRSVLVNGDLTVNGGVVITPSLQPSTPKAGQLYYNQTTNQMAYYNGSEFLTLGSNGQVVDTIGGMTGQVGLGGGLAAVGNQLVNAGVLSVGGKTGSIVLGNGLNMTGNVLQNNGVLSVLAGSGITVTDNGGGSFTVTNSGSGNGTVASSGGTVGHVPLFTGAQDIEDSIITQSGITVTVSGDLAVVTGGLSLSNALTVSNGGTGANSLAANGVIVGGGTGALSSVTAGGAGLCFLSTAGAPTFGACPSASGVTSLNGLTGGVSIANASGAGSIVTIDNASTVAKGIASFNSTNFSVAGGAVNTIQNINSGATPTFAGVNTNNITPSAALTVGVSGQTALLQGSTTTITSNGVGNDIILNSARNIELQDNTNVTGNLGVSGDVAVNGGDITSTGALNVTPTGTLTAGSASQTLTLQGNASTSIRATNAGSTTIVGFVSPTANTTLNFPALSAGAYTICTDSGNCAGAGVTLQAAYSNSTSPEITLDATRGALTIRDTLAGLGANLLEVQNNGGGTTYLAVTSAGIAVTGTATVSGTINTSGGVLQTSGTTRVDNSGNLTNIAALTLSGAISGGTSFTGSGNINTTAGVIQTSSITRIDNSGNLTNIGSLTASGNGTFQGGSLTLGAAAQAGSLVLSDGSSNTGTLQTAALGQNTVYTLPDPGTGSVTVCLSTGNCAGAGGGVTGSGTNNRITKFTSTGSTVGDSTITDNGTTVTTSVDLTIQGGDLTVGVASLQVGTINLADGGSAFSGSITQGSLTAGRTYTLPDSAGTFCLSSGNCLGGGGGGANTALSNLTGVAINTTLLPGAAGTVNLGSGALPFGDVFLAGTSGTPGTNNFKITGASTSGTRVITLPDATGTVCLQSSAACGFAPDSGSANYIQNQIAGAQTADFYISGTGRAATLNGTTGINTGATAGTQRIDASGNLVNIGNLTATGAITVASTGVGNKIILNSASTIELQDNANVTGNLVVTGGAANTLTVLSPDNGSGAVVLNLQQNDADSVLRVTDTGTLAVGNAVNVAGTVAIGNGAGGQFGEIKSTNLTGARSFELPNVSGTICTDAGNCGSATGTLQAAYNYSTGGTTPEIKLDGTRNGIDVQDADTTLGASQNFISFRAPNSLGLGSVLFGVGMQGNLFMQPSTNRTDYIDVNNAAGNNLFTVDSTNGRVGVNLGGVSLPAYTLDVGGDANLVSGSKYRINGAQIASSDLSNDSDLAKLSSSQTFAGNSNVFKNGTNSTAAFSVQNAAGNGVLTVDTTGGQLLLGKASTLDGKLVLNNMTNANTVSFVPGTPTGNRTLTAPDVSGVICTDSGNCAGVGATLQTGYNFSTGGTTPKIKLNSTLNGVDIQDADITIGTSLFNVRASNGAGLGSAMFSVGNTGAVTLQNSSNSTAAMQILTQGGTSVLAADTTNGQIVLGQSTTLNGAIVFNNATNSNQITLTTAAAGSAQTITLPNATGTVCLTSGNCAGVGGTGDILQNGNSFGTAVTLGTNDANALNLETSNVTRLTIAANGSDVTLASNTDLLLQGATAYISNPHGLTNSEFFGLGATFEAGSVGEVTVVGAGSKAGDRSVSFGSSINNTANDSVAIGYGVNITSASAIAIGSGSTAAGDAIAVGDGAAASNASSIALGFAATTTAANQLVIGSNDSTTHHISQVVIGSGVTDTTPNDFTLQGTSGSGANVAGASMSLAGGQGTGTGNGGSINFRIASPGIAGSSLNNLVTVGTFSGANGSLLLQNSVDSTTAFNIKTGPGPSGNLFTVDTTNSRVGINLGGNNVPNLTNNGLQVQGALALTGNSSTAFLNTYTTPLGSGLGTRLSIDSEVLAASQSVIYAGLQSTSNATSRVFTALDARTVAHDPTIGVISPDEAKNFGLSWEGSNSTAYLKSTGATGITISPNTTNAANFTSTAVSLLQNTFITGDLSVSGGDIVSPAAATATGLAIKPGASSANDSTGAAASLTGGDTATGTCATACNGGTVTLQGGAATNGSGTRNGGAVYIDAGSGATANGTINIGTLTSADMTVGKTTGSNSLTLQAGKNVTILNNDSTGTIAIRTATNSSNGIQLQDSGSAALLTADTSARSASGGNLIKIGNSTGTDAATTILQLDAATANPTTNLAALNGGLFYNSTTNKVSLIENGQVKIICNTTDLGCGTGTVTLQNAYHNSTGGTTSEIIAESTQGALDIQDRSTSNGGTLGGNLLNVRATAANDSTAGTLLFGIGNTGAVTSQNSVNSTSAFQIQNAGGAQLLNVDTTNTITDITNNATNNLISNGSMELNSTGWAVLGLASSVARDTFQQYIGGAALKVVTTASNTDGAKFALTTSTLVSNTKYTFTVHARATAGTSFSTFEIGRADNGSTNTSCLTAQTVSNSGWTTLTCTFTTGTTSGTPYIYVKQTDATARTFWIDGIQLTRWSLVANASVEQALTASDWVKKGNVSVAVTRDTTFYSDGASSLKIVTTANANDGTKNNITLNDSTVYTLSFQAWLDSGSAAFATMEAGYSSDGSTDNTTCMTAQTVVANTWTTYTCTFVTPSSHSGTPFIYVKQTNAAIHTFYIDAVQLTNGNPLGSYQEGKIAVNGVINSPVVLQNQANSTDAFQVRNAAGSAVLKVDTVNNNVSVNTSSSSTSTPAFSLLQSDGGDATMLYGNPANSFFVGVDTSDSSQFKISSANSNGSTAKFGYTANTMSPNGYDLGNNNMISATLVTSGGSSGTLNSISVYVGALGGNGQMQVAIYSFKANGVSGCTFASGCPDTKLGSSSTYTLTANSWNTIPVTASIAASTNYWLAFNVDDGGTRYGLATGVGGDVVSYYQNNPGTTTFGRWPTTITTPASSGTGTPYRIYATYTTSNSTDTFAGTSLFTMNADGAAIFKNSTNSNQALQVQNSSGYSVLSVDTYNNDSSTNLITDGGFEKGTSLWGVKDSAQAPDQRFTQHHSGRASLYTQGGNTAGGGGVEYNVTLNDNSQYGASFYIKNSTTDQPKSGVVEAGYNNGTSNTTCSQNTTSITSLAWTRVDCSFTTPGTHSGTPHFYIKRTDTQTDDMWIDDVFLATDYSGFEINSLRNGSVDLQGPISSDLRVQGSVNSSTALVVQNQYANSILTVDTTDSSNLLLNGSFEKDVTNGLSQFVTWNGSGAGTTVSRDMTQAAVGNASLKIAITGTANAGTQINTGNTYPTKVEASSTYSMSWYAKLSSGTFTDIKAGYAPDGSTWVDCVPSSQTVVTGGWTRFSCSFTTTGTAPNGSAAIRIIQTAGASRTFWIDGVRLEAGSTAKQYGNGSITLDAAITSPLLVRNNSDSTNAFTVLNAASVPQFDIDTTNSRVYIGNPTADTTGALLVLDTKNTAGDPTGINGAMYYNSSMAMMRCYTDDIWRPCNQTASLQYGYDFREDFNGAWFTNAPIGETTWDGIGTLGTNILGVTGVDADRMGVIELSTAAGGAGTNVSIWKGQAGVREPVLVGGNMEISTSVSLNALSDVTDEYDVRIGLCDAAAADCTDGLYFEYDRNTSTNWSLVTASNSSRTRIQNSNAACTGGSGSSVAVATGWNRFRIVTNTAGTQASFYINDTFVGCITTNLPTGGGRQTSPMFHIVKSGSGTTARSLDIDYFEMARYSGTKR